MLEVEADADRHEKNCNADGSMHHDNLLADKSAFTPGNDTGRRKGPDCWLFHP